MIRKLLATTAITTILVTGALAQETTQPAPMTPAAPTATDVTPDAAAAPVARADGQLASNLIGENVYNGTGEQAERIGDVNDLVLTDEGQLQAVIVGVGGFLGIGEKNVSVSFDDLTWEERDGDRWIVVETTADALRELPAFDRRAYEPVPAAGAGVATNTMAPAGGMTTTTTDTATAPAAGAAATTDTAAAPAATDTTMTAAVDRNSLTEVPVDQISAENLEGTTVYGVDDANIGDIGDVILAADGKVDSIIIDVGGFLGIGEKPVAVGMDNLSFMQDASGTRYLYTNFTQEQLEAQPAYDEANWTAQRDQMRMTVPN